MILVVGGFDGWDNNARLSTVEVLSDKESNQLPLPSLPTGIDGPSILNHDSSILVCGGWGNENSCLQLTADSWNHHSSLTVPRSRSCGVSTNSASFLFGGYESNFGKDTYEYMDHGSNVWKVGNTNIPGGLDEGCAVAISQEEVWLIGGRNTERRIISFNTISHTFQELSAKLIQGRYAHACARIPGTKKILVTGGWALDSTEIIDITTQSITNASPLNTRRYLHGIGVMTVGKEEKIVVLGGNDGFNWLDDIEVYQDDTQTWTLKDIKLSEAKFSMGVLTVKKGAL